ncbi:MAG: flap endonuclease-1 [Nitrososphaeraceae archaeon]|jgi:flap endonuclease-1|nr:flap endonuclease-1 [Nitrososphaeraceae archaeon]MDW0170705.1 flap endonuclease-1 [Nitrososphaeraceae archaeon]MDW0176500.1 flap endonuclease-1 [Nitrososphaeraceae archaeon]MDW0281734.1 flap endonuclease-1 [Nitrososphaeraceae archaeon]MDW0298088.1 flap endonuclease-1 [Nitrososphaeraceae archaeon]
MGLDLKPLVKSSPIMISELSGKVIAVDAYNTIYQFLATIRGATGELLTNNSGEVTSHLSGLFYRNVNLLAENIKLIYIFDGKPSPLKSKEIERRRQVKQDAFKKYQEAITAGRFEDARKYGQATSVLTDMMVEESKMILTLLGIPYIQAPSEGEAAAAQLTQSNIAFACASQDYDSLLFGAKRLIRNLTISGKRKVPNRNVYVDIEPEIIQQQQLLNETGLNLEQLVDVGIMIGTDFNPGGIPRIGPKTALKLVQEYSKLEKIEKIEDSVVNIPYEEIREIFLKQETPKVDNIEFNEINYNALINFLCVEKNFSATRVNTSLDKLKKSITNRNQSLERWFK